MYTPIRRQQVHHTLLCPCWQRRPEDEVPPLRKQLERGATAILLYTDSIAFCCYCTTSKYYLGYKLHHYYYTTTPKKRDVHTHTHIINDELLQINIEKYIAGARINVRSSNNKQTHTKLEENMSLTSYLSGFTAGFHSNTVGFKIHTPDPTVPHRSVWIECALLQLPLLHQPLSLSSCSVSYVHRNKESTNIFPSCDPLVVSFNQPWFSPPSPRILHSSRPHKERCQTGQQK